MPLDPFVDAVQPNTLRLAIPFTQYLRPDGRKRQGAFEVAGETARKAHDILDKGWHFEAEVLMTGEVSLTVFDGEEDRAIEVVPNGPEVPKAIERLVQRAAEAAKEASNG